MINKISNIKYQILKKVLVENELYVWLFIFTIFLSVFFYLDKGFFNYEGDIQQLKEASAHFEKISPQEITARLKESPRLAQVFSLTFLVSVSIFLYGVYLSARILPGLLKPNFPGFAAVGWTIQDILKAVIVILFFSRILYVGEPIFLKVIGINPPNVFVRSVYRSFLFDLAAVLTVFHFATRRNPSGISALGIKPYNIYANFVFGTIYYIGFVPYLACAIIISLYLSGLFSYESQPLSVFSVFFQAQSRPLIIFFSFFVSVFAPVVEEVFFRGFFYPALRNKAGRLRAALFVSFIFALLHMNMTGFLPIFILSLLLIYLYEKTNSLISPIAVHILHNSIVLYFVFLYRALVL